jgi:hypothetical protein
MGVDTPVQNHRNEGQSPRAVYELRKCKLTIVKRGTGSLSYRVTRGLANCSKIPGFALGEWTTILAS